MGTKSTNKASTIGAGKTSLNVGCGVSEEPRGQKLSGRETESGNRFAIEKSREIFKIRPVFSKECPSQTGSRLLRPWRLVKIHDAALASASMRRHNLVIPGRNMLLEALWDCLGGAPRPAHIRTLRLYRKGGVRPSPYSAARPRGVTWLHDLDCCCCARVF